MTDEDPLKSAHDAVRQAVRDRMEQRGIESVMQLHQMAGVSYNAVNEFLSGARTWPRPATRSKIELALGWEPGEMGRILREFTSGTNKDILPFSGNRDATVAKRTDTSSHFVLDFPDGALNGLSAAEVREMRAAAELAAYQRMREILAARRGGDGDREGRPD